MVSWSMKDGTGKASNLGDQTIEEPQNAVGMSGYSECSITGPFNSKPLNDFPRRAGKCTYGILEVIPIVGPGKVRLGLKVLVESLRYGARCVRSWIPHGGRQDRRKWRKRTSTVARKNIVGVRAEQQCPKEHDGGAGRAPSLKQTRRRKVAA